MNRSPDRFEHDLAAEQRIRRGSPQQPELAADRALLDQLRGLAAQPLPDAVRARVLRSTRQRTRTPWLLAAAAAVALAVAVGVMRQAPAPPAPDRAQMAELGVALNTINRTGRRAVQLAGREVSRSLVMPELGLAELPYADLVRSTLEPKTRPSHPNEEHTQ